MFQSHIINLQIGKRTILQSFLDSESWVIGMYMYLDHIIIRNDYDRIADGFQLFLKIHFHFDIEDSVQHNDKFRTITEFDLRIRLCLQIGG